MWGYNTNMGQFGGPMTPRMNMGGGPRGFNPWMQGIPNGFTPPNFANNMGEVFGGMPGGMGSSNTGQYNIGGPYPLGHFGQTEGGPTQFNMGSQPGKSPGNPMTNMPGQARPPMPGMGGANPPNFFPGFGGGKPGGGQGGILPWLLPQGQGGGGQFMRLALPKGMTQDDYDRAIMGQTPNGFLGFTKPTNDIGKESPQMGQTRQMEIPPHIAQLLGYQKPVNDIYKESPGKSPQTKGNNQWLQQLLMGNPYMGGINRGPQSMGMGIGNYAADGVGMGMGLGSGQWNGLGMGPTPPLSPQQLQARDSMAAFLRANTNPSQWQQPFRPNQPQTNQQLANQYFMSTFGGGMGSRNNQSNSGNYYNLVNPIELLGLGGMSSSAAGQIPGLYYPA